MSSLRGQVLLAGSGMRDPNFAKTGVLIVEHHDEGAMGLVLNRKTPMPMAQAWSQVSEEPFDGEDMLYQGGPCAGPLMVLHSQAAHAQVEVADGVFFATEQEHVAELVLHGTSPRLFFIGYAGWGPGQLEMEMGEKAWLTLPATPELAFAGEDLPWGPLVGRVDPESVYNKIDPRLRPDDPTVN